MMKYCCVWLILILLPLGNQLFGQRQAANWYFGLRCGLDFNSGEPVALIDGNTKANTGTAVISDSVTGELLFYTDGRNFWNREHNLMQNTHAIPFNCYSEMTQPAIIIPSFSDNSLYHVFCIRPLVEDSPPSNTYDCLNAPVMEDLQEDESGLSLFYYLIDMRLNNGLGNVVEDESNVVIQNNVTEKLTAVPHINGTGYWLLVHGWKNNTFYSRHFEDSNLVETVSTNIGSVHGNYGGIYFRDEVEGEMKPSPNGRKIATAVFSEDRPFDLFDFDNATGRLSNYVSLGNISGQYGVSFSPDNSKLYVSSDSRTIDPQFLDIILQYDLNTGDPGSIAASVKSLIINNPKTNLPPGGVIEGWSTAEKGMALAMDGRLYITGNDPRDEISQDDILVVIDKPNESGFNADIYFKEFAFGNGRTGTGLPNFLQSYFNGLESISNCFEGSSVEIYPNPVEDQLQISFNSGCNVSFGLQVLNAIGQIVFSSHQEFKNSCTVDLSPLSAGVYFVLIDISNKKRLIRKVVKL